jgi:hypothetical protein
MTDQKQKRNFREEAEKLDKENREKWHNLLNSDEELLDEDGYPTEHACKVIESWHWSDVDGWFNFIKNIWQHRSLTWQFQDELHSWKKDVLVKRLYVSTFGWSGNETLIRAMKQNDMLWHNTWYQSNRGGHYIFEVEDEDDELVV